MSRVLPVAFHSEVSILQVCLRGDFSCSIGKTFVDRLWIQVEGHVFIVELGDTADDRAPILLGHGVGVLICLSYGTAFDPQRVV